MTNDDTSRIVDQWAGESSSTIEQRSEEATGDGRDDAGALLGLEPSNTEKVGFIAQIEADLHRSKARAPLLGTIASQVVERKRKSRKIMGLWRLSVTNVTGESHVYLPPAPSRHLLFPPGRSGRNAAPVPNRNGEATDRMAVVAGRQESGGGQATPARLRREDGFLDGPG